MFIFKSQQALIRFWQIFQFYVLLFTTTQYIIEGGLEYLSLTEKPLILMITCTAIEMTSVTAFVTVFRAYSTARIDYHLAGC